MESHGRHGPRVCDAFFLWQPCAWGSYNTSLCPDTFLYLAELRDYPWFRCRGTSQFAHLEIKTYFGWTCNSADFDLFRRFFSNYIMLFCLSNRNVSPVNYAKARRWMWSALQGVMFCAYESYDVLPMQSPVSEMVRKSRKIPGHGGAVCGKPFSGSMQRPANSGNSSESSSKSLTSLSFVFFFKAVTLSGKESWCSMSRESAQHRGEFET